MSNDEIIAFLLKKYGLKKYEFKSDIELKKCGLCNGVFFDFNKDTLFILKTIL